MENNRMFRYLEKYVGTYRVVAEYDPQTGNFPRNETGGIDESFDDLYIPCKKGVIKHTYTPELLVWMCDSLGKGRNVRKEIDAKYGVKLPYKYEETSEEVLIYFEDQYIRKLATIVTPKTSGKDIKPYSNRNLPKALYEIPKEDADKLEELVKGMDHVEKMQFTRKCVSDFDKVIQKEKGKKFDITKDRKETKLRPKTYIHYLGLWDKFLEFVKKRIK